MDNDLKKAVQERYRTAALGAGSCCGGDAPCAGCDPISSNPYGDQQADELPGGPSKPRWAAATPQP